MSVFLSNQMHNKIALARVSQIFLVGPLSCEWQSRHISRREVGARVRQIVD